MAKMSDQLSTGRSRAVRLDSFGGPEALNMIDVQAPQAGPGQVRVRVTARALGVPDTRITTVAAQVDGITPINGANAAPGALEKLAHLIATGRLRVPLAATFPVEQNPQRGRAPGRPARARSSSTSGRVSPAVTELP